MKKRKILIFIQLITFFLINYSVYATKSDFILKGHIVDDNGATINGLNVSLRDGSGIEVCKTMSKQIFSYEDDSLLTGRNNLPKILKIPKLKENGYVEMKCSLNEEEIINSELFINEGTFLNIEGGSISVGYNSGTKINKTNSGNILTVGPNPTDNFYIILKRNNNGKYYDLLRKKPYKASTNDLKVDNINTTKIEKFVIYPKIDGYWEGDVLPIQIDGFDYNIEKKENNIISFDPVGKFKNNLVAIKVVIKDFGYEKTFFVKNGDELNIKLPKEQVNNKKYASVFISNDFKDYIFSNTDMMGYFPGMGIHYNGRIVNYQMNKKFLQIDKNQNYVYIDLCELNNCPNFLKIFGKTFVLKNGNYFELSGSGKLLETKKQKTFLSQNTTGYKVFFFLFLFFVIFYIFYSYKKGFLIKK